MKVESEYYKEDEVLDLGVDIEDFTEYVDGIEDAVVHGREGSIYRKKDVDRFRFR